MAQKGKELLHPLWDKYLEKGRQTDLPKVTQSKFLAELRQNLNFPIQGLMNYFHNLAGSFPWKDLLWKQATFMPKFMSSECELFLWLGK